MGLKIQSRDLKTKDTRYLLSLILNQWLSLSTCIIQTVIDIIPTPPAAQATRIPKIIYPEIYESTLAPKNKLEEDLYSSKSDSKAFVVGYVSKMFAVSAKDLPENKKRPITAEEMRAKARNVREAGQAAEGSADVTTQPTGSPIDNVAPQPQQSEIVEAPVDPDAEVLLGFARLYSGTLRVNTLVYALLPKYDTALGPKHPVNAKYLLTAKVEGLYVMMGRELAPVTYVRAGNIFAIKGLESKVWRSATLCSPEELGIGQDFDEEVQKDCLINLGSISRAVSFLLDLLRFS